MVEHRTHCRQCGKPLAACNCQPTALYHCICCDDEYLACPGRQDLSCGRCQGPLCEDQVASVNALDAIAEAESVLVYARWVKSKARIIRRPHTRAA